MKNLITIGLPSKGRLKDKSIAFFNDRDLKILQNYKERNIPIETSSKTQNEKINKFFLNSLPCCSSNFDFKTLISTLPELIFFGFKGFSDTLISFGVSILSVFSVKPLEVINLLNHNLKKKQFS